jgi:hypothetical protein
MKLIISIALIAMVIVGILAIIVDEIIKKL